MALNASEQLAHYESLYVAASAQLEGGAKVYRYRIGNREVYKSELEKHVEWLLKQIEYWSAKVNAQSSGRAKTLARFRRKP